MRGIDILGLLAIATVIYIFWKGTQEGHEHEARKANVSTALHKRLEADRKRGEAIHDAMWAKHEKAMGR